MNDEAKKLALAAVDQAFGLNVVTIFTVLASSVSMASPPDNSQLGAKQHAEAVARAGRGLTIADQVRLDMRSLIEAGEA